MIHFFKFRQDLFDPVPASDTYHKRQPGKGWPEECPPIRAANSFGFDILANFDVTFTFARGAWKASPDIVMESDFNWSGSEEGDGAPLTQQYAWFWQKGQKLPHPISDNVYNVIRHQVKVSSFLYLKTDPNVQLFMTDLPNQARPFRVLSGLVDTDWYPASYCYHVVLELDPREKKIEIRKGTPLCRVIPLRRDTYFAKQMTPGEFDDFFQRGQDWLETHGRVHSDAENKGHLDITHTYVKQQMKSRFVVMK